jgi:ankyrin repeat protein
MLSDTTCPIFIMSDMQIIDLKSTVESTASTPLDKLAEDESPVTFLRSLMKYQRTRYTFSPPDDDLLEQYNMKVVRAVRERDIGSLRELLQNGQCFDACNRNGETLLHLACRRGDVETVTFLIEQAEVRVNVTDDLGRTALHDICWRPEPSFDLMDLLLTKVDPKLLLAEDRRGHTPLDYARQCDWPAWKKYLAQSSHTIERRLSLATQ